MSLKSPFIFPLLKTLTPTSKLGIHHVRFAESPETCGGILYIDNLGELVDIDSLNGRK